MQYFNCCSYGSLSLTRLQTYKDKGSVTSEILAGIEAASVWQVLTTHSSPYLRHPHQTQLRGDVVSVSIHYCVSRLIPPGRAQTVSLYPGYFSLVFLLTQDDFPFKRSQGQGKVWCSGEGLEFRARKTGFESQTYHLFLAVMPQRSNKFCVPASSSIK